MTAKEACGSGRVKIILKLFKKFHTHLMVQGGERRSLKTKA